MLFLASSSAPTNTIYSEAKRMTELTAWQNFYVIAGSSAGALIGLQFVVITLVASMPRKEGLEQAGAAFSTPNVVHFGAVLLLSAIQSAPWRGITGPAILWGLLGTCGVVYKIVTIRLMRIQVAYKPVLEDWMFHAVLPFAAYAMLAISSVAFPWHLHGTLFAVATSALLLLFIGIHNAWDGITYHIFVVRPRQAQK
jgi:hypothetical protein